MFILSPIVTSLLSLSLVHAIPAKESDLSSVSSTTSADPSSSSSSSGSGGGSGRFTYYNPSVGLGSCGNQNDDNSFTVAMNQAQYKSSMCGQTITITVSGKSTQATIQDMCPGCPEGGLDLAEGLFKFFANTDVGVLEGSWTFASGSNTSSGSSTTPANGSETTSSGAGVPASTSDVETSASDNDSSGASATTTSGSESTESAHGHGHGHGHHHDDE